MCARFRCLLSETGKSDDTRRIGGLEIIRSAADPRDPTGPAAVVEDLRKAGYIICNADGWIATAEGCNAIERQLGRSQGGNKT
jgi:hypothetical protein